MSSPPRMTPLYVLTLEFEKLPHTYIQTEPQLYVSKMTYTRTAYMVKFYITDIIASQFSSNSARAVKLFLMVRVVFCNSRLNLMYFFHASMFKFDLPAFCFHIKLRHRLKIIFSFESPFEQLDPKMQNLFRKMIGRARWSRKFLTLS